ncbi:MAG: hypothetical protein ACW99G_00550 [Candidatus Thorarchaeota archaeon]|jgi:hypothetical protein
MPLPLMQYAKIKNNYCICYFGPADEYIVQLLYLRPLIEEKLPGIKIHIGCRDGLSYLANQNERMEIKSTIKEKKRSYAHLKELKCNMEDHPIYDLLEKSNLLNLPKKETKEAYTQRCIISSRGMRPTRDLTTNQIKAINQRYKLQGFKEIYISDDIEGAGIVVGVESTVFYKAACAGIKTVLVPTGLGTDLYKSIVKRPEILNLPE